MLINKSIIISIIFFNLIFKNYLFAENLLEIYYIAVKNDPIVLVARQSKLVDKEQLLVARSSFLPKVTVSSSKQIYGKLTDAVNMNVNNNSNIYSLHIDQPVFQIVDWKRYSMRQKQVLSSLKKYESKEQELILRVAERYFAVLDAVNQLEISKSYIGVFSNILEQITQQFKEGKATIIDVKEAQSRLDIIRIKEIFDTNVLNIAKENLNQILGNSGRVIKNIYPLKQQISLISPDPGNVDLWVEKARKYNLNIQAKILEMEATRDAISVASSEHLPTIKLSGSINKTKQLSLDLNIPIFSGGSVVSNTKVAIYKNNLMLHELEATYREVEVNTRILYNNVLNQIRLIEILKQSIISSKLMLKLTKAAFAIRNKTLIDVLNVQSNMLNVQRDYVHAGCDYILNSLRLKLITGSLVVNDLVQINDLLELKKTIGV